MNNVSNKNNIPLLLVLPGTYIFLCLYVIATIYYPGGSQVDEHAIGFSWKDNYWCNLAMETAINGEYNAARPAALAAMAIILISLSVFWYVFPKYVKLNKNSNFLVRLAGFFSMLSSVFLIGPFHDMAVNIGGVFIIIAIYITSVGLYKSGMKKLALLGIINFLLILCNNVLYYTHGLMAHLPLLQKITFFFFLLWICLIAVNLYCREIESKVPYFPI